MAQKSFYQWLVDNSHAAMLAALDARGCRSMTVIRELIKEDDDYRALYDAWRTE